MKMHFWKKLLILFLKISQYFGGIDDENAFLEEIANFGTFTCWIVSKCNPMRTNSINNLCQEFGWDM